jgi:predicted RNA binding protein YcfA (HicA-like mRNA interferase family)
MTATSDVRRLIRELRRQGWAVQNTGSGHHKLTHPSGEFMFLPHSPSCHRWEKNARAWVRKVEARAQRKETDPSITA